MSTILPVLLLLTVGCAPALVSPPPLASPAMSASASVPTPSVVPHEAPAAPLQPISVTEPATRSGARVPRTEPATDVPPDGAITIKGLTIRVTDILVKRMNTGGDVLRATAHLSAGGKVVEQKFDSDETAFAWNGYLIEMRGGSHEAAAFAVVRAPAAAK